MQQRYTARASVRVRLERRGKSSPGAMATRLRCKPHPMQDPTRGDTAARRASKEIAGALRRRGEWIDDRPTTELGLRPHPLFSAPKHLLWRRFFVGFLRKSPACRRADGAKISASVICLPDGTAARVRPPWASSRRRTSRTCRRDDPPSPGTAGPWSARRSP